MTNIVTREIGDTAKGSPLSNAELDNNFINLNDGKSEKFTQVKNADTVTLTTGMVVVITGSNGSNVTVIRASAASEATSSKTFAVMVDTIAVNETGRCVKDDFIENIDTSALSEGSILWLSTTAGQLAMEPPSAPDHAVFIGYCVRSHASAGKILVKIQNGYELSELHDVLIASRASGDTILFDGVAGVWKNVSPDIARTNLGIDSVIVDVRVNTWASNSHTLTTADGITSESRCAMIIYEDGAGGTALTAAGEVICPDETKIYFVKNDATYAVTLKTSTGSGIAVQPSSGMVLFCDGTDVYSATTVIAPRIVSTSTGITTTVNINYDQTVVTALDVNTTIVAGGNGSAVNGQKIVLRITASGASRGLTWDSAFREIGITLPTTLADTKTMYAGMIYNSTAAKWDVVAVSTQA